MRVHVSRDEGEPAEAARLKMPSACPACGGRLHVRELRCGSCRTEIRGSFESPCSSLAALPLRDVEFVELFVRSRGNIKEMEKALGLSYPTVRGILDGIAARLEEASGREPGAQASAASDRDFRADVLSRLERGEIDATRALALLRGSASSPAGREAEAGAAAEGEA
jgi:hypothetical protein